MEVGRPRGPHRPPFVVTRWASAARSKGATACTRGGRSPAAARARRPAGRVLSETVSTEAAWIPCSAGGWDRAAVRRKRRRHGPPEGLFVELGPRGELGAQAAEERFVDGAGEPGRMPAPLSGEDCAVRSDRPRGGGHQAGGRPRRGFAEQVDGARGGLPLERHRGRGHQVQPLGDRGRMGRCDDDLLGLGAGRSKPTGRPGAGGQTDAGACRVHFTGEVPAQARVLGLVDHPQGVEEARRDVDVGGVDRPAAMATWTWPGPGARRAPR